MKLKVKQLGRQWSMLVGVQRQLARRLLMRLALVELMRTLRENHAEELERLAGGLTHVRE